MGESRKLWDDLTLEDATEDELERGVVITVGTHKGKPLDLRKISREALEALSDGDPRAIRIVFGPKPPRTPEETEAIRVAAREAKNADGTPMFDVKEKGRIPNAMETWYNTVYLPAQGKAHGGS